MVVPDSCLVEIAAIGFHTVAFLVAALHSVQLLVVVAADICVAMEASDNFLEYFCKISKINIAINKNLSRFKL